MTKKLLRLIILSEFIIGALAIGFIVLALWRTPLGPSMQLPAVVNDQVINASASSDEDFQEELTAAAPTPTPAGLADQIASLFKPAPTSLPRGLCDAPAVMTFLVIGSDQRDPYYIYGLADSMRLVRIDTVEPSMMVLDLPRDLWVQIPGLSEPGLTHGKLNQAYAYGNPNLGYYSGPGEGPGLLARTLQLNYGVTGITHYVAMNMNTFKNIIDSMGGVDVYINYRVDLNQGQDGANPDYVYEPGYYHLDGERALMFARMRIPTIFQRARLQTMLLEGMKAKLLSPGMLPYVPGLISQFYEAVQTDLSASDIEQLVCLSEKFNSDNIRFVAFPDDMFTSESTYDPYRKANTFTLGVDENRLREYFAAFKDGTWPQE